jgi:hypothetical protein
VGIGIGILLLAIQVPFAALIGAFVLLLFVTFSGNLDIFAGFVLWLPALSLENKLHFMENAFDPILAAEPFGSGTWGNLMESALRWIGLYALCLTVAIIVLKLLIRDENGIPDHVNVKVSLGCGLVIGALLWWMAAIRLPGTMVVWGLAGAGLGFIVALIPGPPWK